VIPEIKKTVVQAGETVRFNVLIKSIFSRASRTLRDATQVG